MREKQERVIGVTNSRVVKVKEIYEQNTRGIFSSGVYILCNILGACPGEFIEAIRCSTSFNGRRTCVLGFVWIAVQDIHFGLDLASRKQWFVA